MIVLSGSSACWKCMRYEIWLSMQCHNANVSKSEFPVMLNCENVSNHYHMDTHRATNKMWVNNFKCISPNQNKNIIQSNINSSPTTALTMLILGLRPANERRRCKVTTSLIGWVQTYNQPCPYTVLMTQAEVHDKFLLLPASWVIAGHIWHMLRVWSCDVITWDKTISTFLSLYWAVIGQSHRWIIHTSENPFSDAYLRHDCVNCTQLSFGPDVIHHVQGRYTHGQLLHYIITFANGRSTEDMVVSVCPGRLLNSSTSAQNGRYFTDNILKHIFMNYKICILIRFSPKFVPQGPIDNKSAVVQVIVCRWTGNKPLRDPMLTHFTHIFGTRAKWVNNITYEISSLYCLTLVCYGWMDRFSCVHEIFQTHFVCFVLAQWTPFTNMI